MSSHVVFKVFLIQIEREIKNISCYHYLKLDASFGLLGTKRLRLLVKCVHHHQNSVDRNSVRVIAHLLVTSIDRLVACRWRAIELVFTNTVVCVEQCVKHIETSIDDKPINKYISLNAQEQNESELLICARNSNRTIRMEKNNNGLCLKCKWCA